MSRRYLSQQEAEAMLLSGKEVECFLGQCERDGVVGVRWLSIRLSKDKNHIELRRYEAEDVGSSEYTDLYSFGPLDPRVEFADEDELIVFEDFAELWQTLEQLFPRSSKLLVNAGVVQEEYSDYKAKGEA